MWKNFTPLNPVLLNIYNVDVIHLKYRFFCFLEKYNWHPHTGLLDVSAWVKNYKIIFCSSSFLSTFLQNKKSRLLEAVLLLVVLNSEN